ncbi:MAG: hypothetical protein LBU32_31850 [Clostridiales bacterium]|nr:hypothetical protein [Clostridiales bacterium]
MFVGKIGTFDCKAVYKEIAGRTFHAEEEIGDGVPAEAEALPGDPAAEIGDRSEASARREGREGEDAVPIPELAGMAREHAREIKGGGPAAFSRSGPKPTPPLPDVLRRKKESSPATAGKTPRPGQAAPAPFSKIAAGAEGSAFTADALNAQAEIAKCIIEAKLCGR